jgi:hypothetical protein
MFVKPNFLFTILRAVIYCGWTFVRVCRFSQYEDVWDVAPYSLAENDRRYSVLTASIISLTNSFCGCTALEEYWPPHVFASIIRETGFCQTHSTAHHPRHVQMYCCEARERYRLDTGWKLLLKWCSLSILKNFQSKVVDKIFLCSMACMPNLNFESFNKVVFHPLN